MISKICIFGVSYVRDEVSPYGPLFFIKSLMLITTNFT